MKSIKKLFQATLALAIVLCATQASAMYMSQEKQAQIDGIQTEITTLYNKKDLLQKRIYSAKNSQDQAIMRRQLNNINDQIEIKTKELAGLKGQL